MHTVYLVRDPQTQPPSYLSFVADSSETVIAETAAASEKYSEVLLHASILFKIYRRADYDIASFIESPYDSLAITSYSENEFCVKKTGDHYLFSNLIDKYESLLTRVSPAQAFKILKRENHLTPEQRLKLTAFLRMRPEDER